MNTATQTPADRSNAKAAPGSSQAAVLPHESHDQYDRLAADYRAQFHPNGVHEEFLVTEMINSRWRLSRIERLQSAAFAQILGEPGAPAEADSRLLAAITQSTGAIDKLECYAAAAKRAYYQAHRALQQARKPQTTAPKATREDNAALEALLDKYCSPPAPQHHDDWIFQNEPNAPTAEFDEFLKGSL